MKEQLKYLDLEKKVINLGINAEFIKRTGKLREYKNKKAEVIYLKEWKRGDIK